MMPSVDITNSQQNAFVQDWLLAWAREHTVYGTDDWPVAADKKALRLRNTPYARSSDDLEADAVAFDNVIEQLQETYHPQDNT